MSVAERTRRERLDICGNKHFSAFRADKETSLRHSFRVRTSKMIFGGIDVFHTGNIPRFSENSNCFQKIFLHKRPASQETQKLSPSTANSFSTNKKADCGQPFQLSAIGKYTLTSAAEHHDVSAAEASDAARVAAAHHNVPAGASGAVRVAAAEAEASGAVRVSAAEAEASGAVRVSAAGAASDAAGAASDAAEAASGAAVAASGAAAVAAVRDAELKRPAKLQPNSQCRRPKQRLCRHDV